MSQNIDVFKPVRVKSGLKATILNIWVNPPTDWPIRARVETKDGEQDFSYTLEGVYGFDKIPSDEDLENVPETKTFWVNVYDRKEHRVHKSEEAAVSGAFCGGSINKQDPILFARVKVTAEKGEGLG